ncbi:Gfo/Idh/MocA family oxidoreductase [Pseudonocardia abyssalis]|uniref:Inositol 2-dehydrogenase n=1 Tax=Pseudonocardia abyssalis TaxID=2792008 RepID=A0ABS6UP83_9PSEU|nr:Gfo/Idh/MocA family oxidoreductase [Pseudonocardia abyssalis]MBW0116241.1 Gfo/Idh/MocA family oxidoreductase [Pseudonocardia abyssalis]MBW0134061.1 Gfo/Idh/MocA family oxidoreductase [Pseudonocardia abyssalis]
MSINVGVIGVGMIGQDHVRRLTHVLSGARVAAVTDVDLDRARAVARDLPGAVLHPTGAALVADPGVDAVVVTSWGPTHEEYVLACVAAGKQVFCEKPLAPTRVACERIVDAETAAGRRLVMVGFMRRYDAQYRAMKEIVAGGGIGLPLLMHAAHRNPSVPDFFTSDMIINDSAVHDIDVARWMFDEEVAAVTVLKPRTSRKAKAGFHDPLLVLLETVSGVLVDVEASVNAGFAYDIRGEVVCEDGTVALSESAGAVVKRAGTYSGRVPADWQERFVRAFDAELQCWVDAVAADRSTGPSAWDGYAATVVCETGLAALRSGAREPVVLRERPDLYGSAA